MKTKFTLPFTFWIILLGVIFTVGGVFLGIYLLSLNIPTWIVLFGIVFILIAAFIFTIRKFNSGINKNRSKNKSPVYLALILLGIFLFQGLNAQDLKSVEAQKFLQTIDPYIPASEDPIFLYKAEWYCDLYKSLFLYSPSLDGDVNHGMLEIVIHTSFEPFIPIDSVRIIMVFEKTKEKYQLTKEFHFPEYIVGDENFELVDIGIDGLNDKARLPKVIFNPNLISELKIPTTGIIEFPSRTSASSEVLAFVDKVDAAITEYLRTKNRLKEFKPPKDYNKKKSSNFEY
jgi:hypothetical protein